MECTPPPTKPSSSAFGTYRSRVSARKTSETSGTCESAPAPRSLRTDSGGAGPGRRFDRTQNGSRIHPAPKSDDASARGKVGLRGPTRGARRRHSSSPASPVSHPGPAWSTWGRHRRRREAAGRRARSIGRKGPVDGTAVLRPPPGPPCRRSRSCRPPRGRRRRGRNRRPCRAKACRSGSRAPLDG
jgi:hypothetical protein